MQTTQHWNKFMHRKHYVLLLVPFGSCMLHYSSSKSNGMVDSRVKSDSICTYVCMDGMRVFAVAIL